MQNLLGVQFVLKLSEDEVVLNYVDLVWLVLDFAHFVHQLLLDSLFDLLIGEPERSIFRNQLVLGPAFGVFVTSLVISDLLSLFFAEFVHVHLVDPQLIGEIL